MQKHEVGVKTKDGVERIVSARHYAHNQSEYTLVRENGWANKMDTLLPDNKKVVAPVNIKKEEKKK